MARLLLLTTALLSAPVAGLRPLGVRVRSMRSRYGRAAMGEDDSGLTNKLKGFAVPTLPSCTLAAPPALVARYAWWHPLLQVLHDEPEHARSAGQSAAVGAGADGSGDA